jgi:hypothetical protein
VPLAGGARVALVPTASYGGGGRATARAAAEADAARLIDDLQLQSCEVLFPFFWLSSLCTRVSTPHGVNFFSRGVRTLG